MWRIWHRLFGWHYASVQFGYSHYVCRVRIDGDGRAYVRIIGTHIDLGKDRFHEWFPLTFPRSWVTGVVDANDQPRLRVVNP